MTVQGQWYHRLHLRDGSENNFSAQAIAIAPGLFALKGAA